MSVEIRVEGGVVAGEGTGVDRDLGLREWVSRFSRGRDGTLERGEKRELLRGDGENGRWI